MALSRRHFLTAALAAAAVPRLAVAQVTADGFIELRARTSALGLLEEGAGKTACWLYGAGPEPAVVTAKQGEEVKLRFINELDSDIWLHFFGVRGPSALMTLNVTPGPDHAVDCVFTPPDAGTFWIGPVADASRARDMGLSAMFIVQEAETIEGVADYPIILDDWRLDDSGAIQNDFGDVETMVGEGRLGNWFTINNHFRPKLPLMQGHFTRLRLLNAANVRTMGVLFKGYDPLLIARDGQPVQPTPLDEKALTLAPGQRADLLVSPEEGDIRMALDLFEDIVEIGYLVRTGDGGGGGEAPRIAENFALPANPITPLPALTDALTFSLRIEGGIKGGLASAKMAGVERDLRTLLEHGKGWAINGVAGPAAEPLFTAVTGSTVLLEIENRTAFAQPIHIHGHVWQELLEQPSGDWRDTAVVPPGETATFAFVADNPGTWAIQSLVAERADGGLIGGFEVKDAEPQL